MNRNAKWLLAGWLLIATPALAELADRDKPVNIEADRVMVMDTGRTAIYDGNVVLSQGSLKITAQRIEVHQDEQGFSRGVATGKPVYFRQKMEGRDEIAEGWAERLDYDSRADRIELTGKARLRRGEEELRGHLIVYDGKRQLYRAEGAATGGAGRVRAVIPPKRGTPDKP